MTGGGGIGAATVGALVLAAALAVGLSLWGDWGVLVFLNGGGLSCF